MKFGVVGAGGVGGYYGGRLALAGADVGFVARGKQLAAIREHGLQIRAHDGDFNVRVAASHDPAELGACDAVLFCVKSYDTEEAADLLPPLLKPATGVLSLQNGIDNEEKISARIGLGHVLGGVSFILTHIAEPGVVEQTGSVQRIVFGELDGSSSERTEALVAEFERANIETEVSDDVQAVLWDKYAYLCALAGLTAATRLSIDQLLSVAETRELFRRMMGEVVEVARAEGVELPSDLVDQKTAFSEQLAPGSFSSLYHDLTSGRRLELDALHGELIRRARRHGIGVPVSETIYSLLRPWELAQR
jgi:2-dehydropantoate 2-reductase